MADESAATDPVTENLSVSEAGAPDTTTAPSSANTSTDGAGWEFLEILAAVILAAESLRIIGSVIAGIIDATTGPSLAIGQQRLVGNAIESAANFSDGPGIVLLLLTLGMVWWRATHWTERLHNSRASGIAAGDLGVEALQVRRLRGLTRWVLALFILASLGALAYVVGSIVVNTAGGVTTGLQWQAYSDDLFSVAYLILAVAGIVASLKLIALCDADLSLISAES